MKTQTSKCCIFSVLLLHQLSFYMEYLREFFHLSIKYVKISRSLGVVPYTAIHGIKFPKSSPHKIFLAKEWHLPDLQDSKYKPEIDSDSVRLIILVFFCEEFSYFLYKILFFFVTLVCRKIQTSVHNFVDFVTFLLANNNIKWRNIL